MKRKDFIKHATAMAVFGLPMLSIANSCSTDSVSPNSTPDPKDCLANGTSTSIGSNHGHSLEVSKIDVENGAQMTYSIQGTSVHDHEVIITADHFASLKNSKSIQVISTSGSGHTHSVTVSCA